MRRIIRNIFWKSSAELDDFYMTKWLLIILFLFMDFSLYSQKGRLRFDSISLQEGLPQSAVYCILQDQTGFMWFGTQEGLCRYDGFQFKIYRQDYQNPTMISDNYILSIMEDKDGFLWVGTLGGGLNKFDPDSETFTSYEHKTDKSGTLSNNEVHCIVQDRHGNRWIGTKGGGLNRLIDPEKGSFTSYTNNPNDPGSLSHNTVWCIYEGQYGVMWIGTEKSLDKFDLETGRFSHCIRRSHHTGNQRDYKVRCIWEDSEGVVWVGIEVGGLNNLIDKKNGIVEQFQHQSEEGENLRKSTVWCIWEDREKTMWIGTQMGLYKFVRPKNELTRYSPNPSVPRSLSDNDIRSIYQDRSGVIWLGTYGGGINKISVNSGFNIYSHEAQNQASLSNKQVWAFCEDNSGAIWIGTEDGLNKFEPDKDKFTRYKHRQEDSQSINSNKIQYLYVDQEGQLWIGTYGGGLDKLIESSGNGRFIHYKHEKRSDSLSDNKIMCIKEDRSGSLWIGTKNGGINLLKNPSIDIFEHYRMDDSSGLSHNEICCIYEDRNGIIWVGTSGGGLNKYDREKNRFTHSKYEQEVSTSLSHNRVRCIHEDGNSVLWIGTDGGGLNRLKDRQTMEFIYYRKKDGLPNNIIYGILEDNRGNLWLSTNKGLSSFNPKDETFKNFDVYDGLQSNEFNTGAYFKSDSGMMYFGGINGFNVFNPEKITKDNIKPPVVITNLFIFNKPVLLKREDSYSPLEKPVHRTTELTLSYRQNMFTFEFAALHYAAPPKNRYKYQLEGWDKNWISTDSGNRLATYTNLPGGDYVFRVKGTNKDGVWSGEKTAASIKVRILPPAWKTWWAYSLYVLAFIGIMLSLFVWLQRSKIAKERRVKEELEKTVNERTHDLAGKKEALGKINSIVKSINSKMQLTDLLHSILEETKVIKGVEKASALVWEPGIDRFVVKASSGWDMELAAGIKLTRQQADEHYLKGSKEIFPDIFIATNIVDLEHNDKFSSLIMPKTMLIVRIKIENETQAYFIFENMLDENAFIEQDQELLNNLREHFVAAFQKSRLITSLQNTRDQLVQAQKMISLGMMLAEIAHDLKNPSIVFKMNAEYFSRVWEEIVPVLEQFALSDEDFELSGLPFNESRAEVEKLLKGLMDGSKDIQSLIEELRTFSKKEESQTKQPVDVNQVIQSSINLTRNLLNRTTHRFASELAEDLPLFRGNFQKLEQVIINLIQNACQALPESSRGINISTNYDTEKKQIIIKVKDEGVGIEEHNLKHLTEPFFTTKSSTGGIGLGLSITLQIVREHGGKMEFQSSPGIGTTVSVFLPLEFQDEKQKMEN